MTPSQVIDSATTLAQTIGDTTRGHALGKTIDRFVAILDAVLDHPAGAFSDVDISRLGTLAEGVIERVEQHLETDRDDKENQHLVEGIYEIRRVLEEVGRWRRHYLG